MSLNPNATSFQFNAAAPVFVPPAAQGTSPTPGSDFEFDEGDVFEEDVAPAQLKGDEDGGDGSSGFDPHAIVVVGVDQKKSIQKLLGDFAQTCGPVKSYFFRDPTTLQITFEDSDGVEKAVEMMSNATIVGNQLQVRRSRLDSYSGAGQIIEEKTSTLVLKNLPYTLRKDVLEEKLNSLSVCPQSITYHQDATGTFRGVVFVKYRGVEDASQAYDLLQSFDIAGRRARVEFKRRSGVKGLTSDIESLDEETRAVCEQIIAFADDQWNQEMVIPMCLNPVQRKRVHAIAEKLGLGHVSQTDGDVRQITVWKVKGRKGSSSSGAISISRATPPSRGAGPFDFGRFSYEKDKTGSGGWGSLPDRRANARTYQEPSVLSVSPITFKSLEGLRSERALNNANIFQPSSQPTGPDASKSFRRPRTESIPSFIKMPEIPENKDSGNADKSNESEDKIESSANAAVATDTDPKASVAPRPDTAPN